MAINNNYYPTTSGDDKYAICSSVNFKTDQLLNVSVASFVSPGSIEAVSISSNKTNNVRTYDVVGTYTINYRCILQQNGQVVYGYSDQSGSTKLPLISSKWIPVTKYKYNKLVIIPQINYTFVNDEGTVQTLSCSINDMDTKIPSNAYVTGIQYTIKYAYHTTTLYMGSLNVVGIDTRKHQYLGVGPYTNAYNSSGLSGPSINQCVGFSISERSSGLFSTVVLVSKGLGWRIQLIGNTYYCVFTKSRGGKGGIGGSGGNPTPDQIKENAAREGFAFSTKNPSETDPNKIGEDPDIYIPETDNDGKPTGKYNPSNSEKAQTDPKMQDEYDPFGHVKPIESIDEDPGKSIGAGSNEPGGGGNKEDPELSDKIKSSDDTNKLPTINLFNRTFALTVDQVKSLADELWNADDTRFEEIKNGLALMGGNPIQGLIDLRLYPIDFSSWAGSNTRITVGRTQLDTTGRLIETNTLPQFTASLGKIYGKYGTFMDFEPFSIFQIYLPFVGTTDIPANLVIGHEISCKASVDIITGAISYIVKADGYPILYKNGTIGVSIPMTADNAAEYALGVIHATNNVVQTGADTVKTVAKDVAKATSVKGAITDPSSNVAGAVSAGADIVAGASAIATAGADLSTTVNQTTIQQSGTASPSNSLYTSMAVYILQESHNPVIPGNYAHDIGIACRLSGSVGSFSGYTQFSNVDLTGINCTESERTIILETLQNGVYL